MVAAEHLVQYNTMSVSTVYYLFLARYKIVNLNIKQKQCRNFCKVNIYFHPSFVTFNCHE